MFIIYNNVLELWGDLLLKGLLTPSYWFYSKRIGNYVKRRDNGKWEVWQKTKMAGNLSVYRAKPNSNDRKRFRKEFNKLIKRRVK